MKKLLTAFFILLSHTLLAQFTIPQTIGSKSTIVRSKGALSADSGYVNAVFPDTLTATNNKIATYPGALMRVGNSIYLRDSTATLWQQVANLSDVSPIIDTLIAHSNKYDSAYVSFETNGDSTLLILYHSNRSIPADTAYAFGEGGVGGGSISGNTIYSADDTIKNNLHFGGRTVYVPNADWFQISDPAVNNYIYFAPNPGNEGIGWGVWDTANGRRGSYIQSVASLNYTFNSLGVYEGINPYSHTIPLFEQYIDTSANPSWTEIDADSIILKGKVRMQELASHGSGVVGVDNNGNLSWNAGAAANLIIWVGTPTPSGVLADSTAFGAALRLDSENPNAKINSYNIVPYGFELSIININVEGLNELPVKLFYNNTDIVYIKDLGAGINSVGSSAFNGTTNMAGIDLPNVNNFLGSIGDSAFANMTGGASIFLPEYNDSLYFGTNLFYNNNSIQLTVLQHGPNVGAIEAANNFTANVLANTSASQSTFYNADGTLTGGAFTSKRIVTTSGKDIYFEGSAAGLFAILDDGSFYSAVPGSYPMMGTDFTGFSGAGRVAFMGDYGKIYHGTHIINDDSLHYCEIKNDSIRFVDPSLSSASNGYVWTLEDQTKGTGKWAVSGSTQNLQSVTTVGSTTTNSVTVLSNSNAVQAFGTAGTTGISEGYLGGSAAISWVKPSSTVTVKSDSISSNKALQLPNGNGVMALTVNGTHADGTGNITIPSTLPYTEYVAIITQASGSAAPTVAVLLNTTGTTITWTRTAAGAYQGAAGSSIFTANKTILNNVIMGVTTPNVVFSVMGGGGPSSIVAKYSMWINGAAIDVDTYDGSNTSTDWFTSVGASAGITVDAKIYP